MNNLPLVIENIIHDYRFQLETSDKMDKVMRQLLNLKRNTYYHWYRYDESDSEMTNENRENVLLVFQNLNCDNHITYYIMDEFIFGRNKTMVYRYRRDID